MGIPSKSAEMNRWEWRQICKGVNTFDASGPFSLLAVYCTIASSGLLDRLFYCVPTPDFPAFKERFEKEGMNGYLWAYCAFDRETKQPLAFVFVNDFIGKAGMLHFCVFKHGLAIKEDIGKTWLSFMFDNEKNKETLSCFIGVTPVVYKRALDFVFSLGFKPQTIIPSGCYMKLRETYVDGLVTMYKP